MSNEKRLIDANALLNTLERYVNPMPGEHGNGYLSGLATAMDEVEAAPTVDAVEVVHGRWVRKSWWQHKNRYEVDECSVCGYQVKPKYAHNYCHNCGADMRDGDGNE